MLQRDLHRDVRKYAGVDAPEEPVTLEDLRGALVVRQRDAEGTGHFRQPLIFVRTHFLVGDHVIEDQLNGAKRFFFGTVASTQSVTDPGQRKCDRAWRVPRT